MVRVGRLFVYLSRYNSDQKRPIFPVCLLLENKSCLVVGGGKIATRKVSLLIQASAQVTVIAPQISDELIALSESHSITHINRQFIDSDLNNHKLVYCATNDKGVNQHILDLCKQKGILCCSIDSGWIDGDFLTPAVIRCDDLTVSVSTGGRACRRSRLVKASLSKHLSLLNNSTLAVIGTSHLELPTERREHLHCSGDDYQSKTNMIRQIWGVHEFVLLNTCNRIELIFSGCVTTELLHLLKKILNFDSLQDNEYYFKQGIQAFEHGVALCGGLLSQLAGENHITAQMKETVAASIESSCAGTIMQEWFSSTLHLSREVRQATSQLLRNEEYEDVALKFIQCEMSSRTISPAIAIIGTGVVGSSMMNMLLTAFPELICEWIYHSRKPDIPSELQNRVKVSQFEKLPEVSKKSDIIISAIRTDNPVITNDNRFVFKSGSILIDLSLPRSIDPGIKDTTENITVLDLDGLNKWYRIEQVNRDDLLSICNRIVHANRDIYDKLITSITGRNS